MCRARGRGHHGPSARVNDLFSILMNEMKRYCTFIIFASLRGITPGASIASSQHPYPPPPRSPTLVAPLPHTDSGHAAVCEHRPAEMPRCISSQSCPDAALRQAFERWPTADSADTNTCSNYRRRSEVRRSHAGNRCADTSQLNTCSHLSLSLRSRPLVMQDQSTRSQTAQLTFLRLHPLPSHPVDERE